MQQARKKHTEVLVDTVDNGYLVQYFDDEKKVQRAYYFETPAEVGNFIANHYEMMKEAVNGKQAVS